jgi:hypothetical protein
MRRAASTSSMPGIRTSLSTTSGRSSSTWATASCRYLATPSLDVGLAAQDEADADELHPLT